MSKHKIKGKMQLRLAEYKNGKFERFLELSMSRDGFGYYGDRIVIRRFVKISNHPVHEYLDTEDVYCLEEKDPLNRFNGLFDGRTYGQGRFVLIKDGDFEFYEQKLLNEKKDEKYLYGFSLNGKISCAFKNTSDFAGQYVTSTLPKLIGNLHENPELFLKI